MYASKKVFVKKAEKLCLIGEIVIESHSFLELTETLNSRVLASWSARDAYPPIVARGIKKNLTDVNPGLP